MIHSFEGKSPQIHESVFIAPDANVIGDVRLGKESGVWFGVTLRGDIHHISIGDQTNIQDNSTVHVTAEQFPVEIGNRVSIAHDVMIHGCVIEDECLIAMKSCIIAAGALVTEGMEVPPYSLVMGVPGKIVRKVSEKELHRIKLNWEHYVDYAKRWKKELK